MKMYSKIAGVTFEGRQKIVGNLAVGQRLKLVREPNNPYDPNAIAIKTEDSQHLGYINKKLASAIAPEMDSGVKFRASVSSVTGGNGKNYGINIEIVRIDKPVCFGFFMMPNV